jgi:hypothetical protein
MIGKLDIYIGEIFVVHIPVLFWRGSDLSWDDMYQSQDLNLTLLDRKSGILSCDLCFSYQHHTVVINCKIIERETFHCCKIDHFC